MPSHRSQGALLRMLFLSLTLSSPTCNALIPRAYSTTTVFSTVTVSAVAPSTPAPSTWTNGADLQESILNSTNFWRYDYNATALSWNVSLAASAYDWASQCLFKHSGGPSGENLAEGYADPIFAVDGWGNEVARYDFKQTTGFSEDTGHFTQLIWKSTTTVGCAAVNCTRQNSIGGFYLVCEYYPAGNVLAAEGDKNAYFEQNVQPKVNNGPPPSGTGTSTAITTPSATGVHGSEAPTGRLAESFWTCIVTIVAIVVAAAMS